MKKLVSCKKGQSYLRIHKFTSRYTNLKVKHVFLKGVKIKIANLDSERSFLVIIIKNYILFSHFYSECQKHPYILMIL